MPIEPGDQAPDFTLPDQHGQPFTLSRSLRERKAPHLVYFYPKADTPGCTAQACGLRDALPEAEGVVVVGISPDPPARQARFDEKYGLGFPLLADEDHAVAEAWGVWGERSMYGRTYLGIVRSAFVVGPDGREAEAHYKVSPKATPPLLAAAARPASAAGGG
jgi:peroxiredoxin Q/BCP